MLSIFYSKNIEFTLKLLYILSNYFDIFIEFRTLIVFYLYLLSTCTNSDKVASMCPTMFDIRVAPPWDVKIGQAKRHWHHVDD